VAIKNQNVNSYLDSIYKANIDLIWEVFPQFYNALQRVGDHRDNLELTGKQEINIRLRGERIYPSEVEAHIRQQFREFCKKPQGIEINPLIPDHYRSGPNFELQRKIYQNSPIVKEGKRFHKSYKFPGDQIPLLIVLGVGNGLHLEYLLNRFRVRNLIIIEDSLEMLKTSLYMTNWGRVLRPIFSDNCKVNFLWGPSVEWVSSSIVGAAGKHNPVFAASSLIYKNYSSTFFENVLEDIREKWELVFQGWGFFDDEYITIKQTLRNEAQGVPLLRKSPEKVPDVPVYLIGNGPSLDKAIPALKENRQGALLISGGTAIGPLYRNGIRPDIHVEMERGYVTYRALVNDVPREYLKDIDFIGPARLHPEVFNLFPKSLMYIKDMDAGGSLYPASDFRVHRENPTVSNAVVALALDLGFRRIALFGMDMGVRDPAEHHSKHSLYYAKSSFSKSAKHFSFGKEVEANFGGLAYTNGELFWSKTNLETRFALAEGIESYNTSDGAKISGVKSWPLERGLPDLEFDVLKKGVLKKIRKSFDVSSESRISITRLYCCMENLREVQTSLQELLGGPVGARQQILDRFSAVHHYMLNVVKEKDGLVYYAFRGTMLHSQAILFTHAYSCEDEEEAVQFLNRGIGLVREFLEYAANEVEALIWVGVKALRDGENNLETLPSGVAPFKANVGWESI